MPTVFIHFESDIVAVATGRVMRRGLGVTMEVVVGLEHRTAMSSMGLARLFFDGKAKEAAKANFIQELRSDNILKRNVGKTKWDVQLRAHSTVHTTHASIEQYYSNVIFQGLKPDDHMQEMLFLINQALMELQEQLHKEQP